MSQNTPKARMRQRPKPTHVSGGHDPHRPVGYANPPKANQFQPGKSGNPKGRPKGPKDINTILHERLNMRIKIREGGRTKSVSILEAKIAQLTKSMLEGDDKATNLILRLLQHYRRDAEDAGKPSDRVFSEEDDRQLIEELLRMGGRVPPDTEGS
tara:strand:- start:2120 stop:2584 length:465 start_codon:yes stop_codon:yes gene_type:complete